MRKCPFCAEDVQDDALVCRHCGRAGNAYQPNAPSMAPSMAPQKQPMAPKTQPTAQNKKATVGRWVLRGLAVLTGFVGLMVALGGILAVLLTPSENSTPTPAAQRISRLDAERRSAADEARKRATVQLIDNTDWRDPEHIAELCESSDATQLTTKIRSRCAVAHLVMTRTYLKAFKLPVAQQTFELALKDGASPAARADVEKLLTEAIDAQAQRVRETSARSESNARQAYGMAMRERYLDENLDIKVKVSGTLNERLLLQFVLFDAVWAHKFQKGDLLDEMRRLGFLHFDIDDGYHYHASWDLTK